MNLYFYWYSIVYGFYYTFSKEFYYDLAAIGLFSIIVNFLCIGLISIISFLAGLNELLFKSPIFILSVYLIIYLINIILFAPKKRQTRLQNKFRQDQSLTKDILSIIMTVLSLVTFIIAIILNTKN